MKKSLVVGLGAVFGAAGAGVGQITQFTPAAQAAVERLRQEELLPEGVPLQAATAVVAVGLYLCVVLMVWFTKWVSNDEVTKLIAEEQKSEASTKLKEKFADLVVGLEPTVAKDEQKLRKLEQELQTAAKAYESAKAAYKSWKRNAERNQRTATLKQAKVRLEKLEKA